MMMFGCRETHDIVKKMLGCGCFSGCGVCSCLFNWFGEVVSNQSHYLLCSAYWEVFGLFKIVSVKLL